jgi:hypothetical protein
MSNAVVQFWEARDVAFWLCIPAKRVAQLARDRVIPHVELPSGELLFDSAELAEWVRQFRRPVLADRGAGHAL